MVPAEIKRAEARQLERLAGDQFLRHREDATGARHRYALRARLTLMLGIGVGIIRGVVDRAAARPEPARAHLVRIGLACDGIGDVRGSWMHWRTSAREPCHREVETALSDCL